jgi:cell division protein FtsW
MQAVKSPAVAPQLRVDEVLPALLAALCCVGFVTMGSASMDFAAVEYGQPFYFIWRHGVFMVMSLIVLIVTLQIPVRVWEAAGPVLLVIGLTLLAILLLPGVGREVNGATRWVRLGFFNVQLSEPMKLFLIVYLAGYMTRRARELRTSWTGMSTPLGLLAGVMLLLLLEPDFGAAVVIGGTAMGMLFLGGARLMPFIALVVIGVAGVALLALLEPYRMQRLIAFINPWADQFDSGYQLTQALIAFGRGEVFGVGLGNSVQKLLYLPEAHTDFVFAILAEELGFLGCLSVIALFGALIARILWIARVAMQRQQNFAAYVCCGTALLLAAQVFINIGVNAGLLPTKGLTLPFLSYGGSSLLTLAVMMGLILRIESELRMPAAAVGLPWRFGHA